VGFEGDMSSATGMAYFWTLSVHLFEILFLSESEDFQILQSLMMVNS